MYQNIIDIIEKMDEKELSILYMWAAHKKGFNSKRWKQCYRVVLIVLSKPLGEKDKARRFVEQTTREWLPVDIIIGHNGKIYSKLCLF